MQHWDLAHYNSRKLGLQTPPTRIIHADFQETAEN